MDGSLFGCLIDAEGHGLRAAMQIRLLLDTIHDSRWRESPILSAMIEMERIICRSRVLQAESAAFPMALFRINPRRNRLIYANAGMPFPIIYRGGEIVEPPRASGWKLGRGYENRNSGEASFSIEPNDILIMATDGVFEGQVFGGGQLRGQLRAILSGVQSAREVVDRVSTALEAGRKEGLATPYDSALIAIACSAVDSIDEWSVDVRKDEHTYTWLHDDVRPTALKWLRKHRLSEERSNAIWMASWEAILNGLKHGTSSGGSCKFSFRRHSDRIELWVLQDLVWSDWERHFRSIQAWRDDVPFPIVCGTRIMTKLSDEFGVDTFGTRLRLTFKIRPQ